MFYLFMSKDNKLKIQKRRLRAAFEKSLSPIDYKKDIEMQFENLFRDYKEFVLPMTKILQERLADKEESIEILYLHKDLLDNYFKKYISDTSHWWPGEPYSGIPQIGAKGEFVNMFEMNTIANGAIISSARIEVEKFLISKINKVPELIKLYKLI
jgi:hypothetical protein